MQAKGRLNEDSLRLFSEAGIRFENAKRKLLSKSEDFPIEVLYLRDDDIPSAVANGVADIGFVGINEIEEKGFDVEVVHKLGWGRCRISLAIPKSEQYDDISWFEGKRIATSYPNILGKFFAENNITATIEEIAGSVEIAPAVGMADAIFDIVSSGSTLISNGLKEVHAVMKSEAALIATPSLSDEKRELLDQLVFRFESIERSAGKKYILFNIPNEKIEEALSIVPSLKSPTLLPLADKSWSSIHAVVDESVVWDKINMLKSIGAEDLLVLSLEMMVL